MTIREIAAFATASVLLACSVSCSSKESSDKQESTTAPTVEGVEAADAVEAKSGDAYLAITDSAFEVQYFGEKDVNGSNQLSYEAGVAHISGNGDYTVSVTADTNGLRYDQTGDINGEYSVKGVGFAAVVIENAEEALPNAVITVKSVRVDGRELELKKKNYTNTESGAVRANIYNEWVSDDALPTDARTAEGALFENGNPDTPSSINDGSFSAQIVEREEFGEWKNVEVDFTVSGF